MPSIEPTPVVLDRRGTMIGSLFATRPYKLTAIS